MNFFHLALVYHIERINVRPLAYVGLSMEYRDTMCSVYAKQAWKIVTLMTAGVVVMAMIGCQVHPTALDQTQAFPSGHHRAPAPHAAFDLNCLVATLPTVVSFLTVYLCTPYTPDQLVHPTGFASLLFIPPKAMLRAHSV